MSSQRFVSAIIICLWTGCSSPEPATDDVAIDDVGRADVLVSPDGAVTSDRGASDLGAPDIGPQPVEAADYCEATVDMFCDYYLRCGRMAAVDMTECREAFLETCNEVFEPRYVSYVDRGLLELSSAGIEQCREHLADVECTIQLFDLDLGCSNIWVGKASVGDACAPGIGSFVCDSASVCTLDLTLCGTCSEAATVGATCGGDVRCVTGAQCIDEVCVARALPGESCTDRPCVTGAACVADFCRGNLIVEVGQACDQARRCPYNSTCRSGGCVKSAPLGGDCIVADCASGWCSGGVCTAFGAPGSACTVGPECLSGQCSGTCGELEQACFE